MEGNVSVEFDCLKANLSLGYFGASAGAYWFEATASQEYDLFGKKVRLTIGENSGVGASLSVGKKTVVGLTLGYGFVFSIEVL